MEHIWAPWRIEYILSQKPEGCILCDKPNEQKDKENLILYRGKKNFVIMNLYPYNPGHLMVTPYKHTSNLEDLDDEELLELFSIVRRTTQVLKETFKPGGFNIGMNLGRVAGAGIDEHLHVHIVPRWNGDTNCMPVLTGTRVIPQALEETYEMLQGKI
ncbi:HIT domain-containing protein [Chloroflexota bacterium]